MRVLDVMDAFVESCHRELEVFGSDLEELEGKLTNLSLERTYAVSHDLVYLPQSFNSTL